MYDKIIESNKQILNSIQILDMNKIKLSSEALAKLNDTSKLLDLKYGKHGTPERDKFEKEALDYYDDIAKVGKDGNEDMQ